MIYLFSHSSLVKISLILEAMIFQFRVDMFFTQNNEKTTSDFIMCVCVYFKYMHIQNKSKTNGFLCLISGVLVLLNGHSELYCNEDKMVMTIFSYLKEK